MQGTHHKVTVLEPALQQVHRRMANKARHEDVGRAAVEFIGRGELLELPRREDHNAVSHRQGLCLIVGD